MTIHFAASSGDWETLAREIASGTTIDARDEAYMTPLAYALESLRASVDIVSELLRCGADPNATIGNKDKRVLDVAVASGDLDKVRALWEAGAATNYVLASGYTVMVNAAYSLCEHPQLVPMLELLVECGADIDRETDYRESPLSVTSRSRFDAVRALLAAGAKPISVQWDPLMVAITRGDLAAIQRLIASGADLSHRDKFERTPLHLSIVAGNLDALKMLISAGASVHDLARGGTTALMLAAEHGQTQLLQFLLQSGADLEIADEMGRTALMCAASSGAVDCVRQLLDAGAAPGRRNEYGDGAISLAANEQVVRMLVAAGEDLNDISTEMKRHLTGLSDDPELTVSERDFEAGSQPRFGIANPELMNVPFWNAMIRTGISAYQGRKRFKGRSCGDVYPAWCFDRFGMSFTELPDGRIVRIGGEHEDFYDADFCIYNDVVVHDMPGSFQIFGYPKHVFPPTDFHSATYWDGHIFIIGGLGYSGERTFGTTPVYRLNCINWSIEPIATSGEIPGWIYGHRGRLTLPGVIELSGGKICHVSGDEEVHVDNERVFKFNIGDRTWSLE